MLFPFRPSMMLVALALVTGAAAGCKRSDARREPPDPSITGSTERAGNSATVTLKPADGDLAQLLQAESKKAQARNLKPFAELRADWCGPCKQIDANRNDPRMADAFQGTYLIRLDVDAWAGKLAGSGLEAKAIPVFFALDEKGKATGRRIDGGAWAEDTVANMAPPLKAFFSAR